MNRNNFISAVLCVDLMLTLFIAGTTQVYAQPVFIDDFNDRNDDGWNHVGIVGGQGPGIWDPSTGAYNLRSSTEVSVGTAGGVFSFWEESNADRFLHGFLRAKVRANTLGTTVGLVLRGDGGFSNGYYFLGSTEGGNFRAFNCVSSTCDSLQYTDVPFAPGEDWFIEAGAVKDEITMKVWRVGDQAPADPQLRFRAESHSSGYFGVEAHISTGFATPAITDGVFDDIVFYPAFPEIPTDTQVLLSPKNGQLAGQVYAVRKDTQAVLDGVAWRLESLETQTMPAGPGLETQWYTATNWDRRSQWDEAIEHGRPSSRQFALPTISWSDANGQIGYRPEVADLGANQNSYSVRAKGEIFIPEPGVYHFKDGVDRYAYLAIAGQELIEDDSTAQHDGTRRSTGSPIVTLDMSNVNANGEWVPIEFRMSETSGRDNAALYWDYDPSAPEGNRVGQNKAFPAAIDQPAELAALVPESHLRHGEFRRVTSTRLLASGKGGIGGPGVEGLLDLPAKDGDVVRVSLNLVGDFDITSANYYYDVVVGNLPLADLNRNGMIDVNDVDLLATAIRTGNTQLRFDLNNDSRVDGVDRKLWIETLARTYFGDANLDGEFNSADLVQVFQTGEYEDGRARNSTWSEGDWDGDADVTSGDFVVAFQDGGYEKGPRTGLAAVPEPSAAVLTLLGIVCVIRRRSR